MFCYIDQMSTPDLLSDQVWAELDPAGARIGWVSRRVQLVAGIAAVVLATLAVLSQTSGELGSPLDNSSGTGTYDPATHTDIETMSLHNDGWFTEHITAVTFHAPGAVVIRSSGAGTTIAPGHTGTVSVTFRVFDCTQFSSTADRAVNVQLHRFWGTKTQSFSELTGASGSGCSHP